MVTDPKAAADPGWDALARVAAGEVEAFAGIVEAHQERLLRLCERLLGDPEEARDAAQEVFLRAFRKAGAFRPRGQVYTWLYRIAVNLCLNRLRRRRIVRFVRLGGAAVEDDQTPVPEPPDPAPGPETALAARERWQATRRELACLPESQRAAVILVRFEGLSYREAAEVLGVTEGAVESRLVRAMRRLTRAQEAAAPEVPERERVR